jgi:hypothetical protein
VPGRQLLLLLLLELVSEVPLQKQLHHAPCLVVLLLLLVVVCEA